MASSASNMRDGWMIHSPTGPVVVNDEQKAPADCMPAVAVVHSGQWWCGRRARLHCVDAATHSAVAVLRDGRTPTGQMYCSARSTAEASRGLLHSCSSVSLYLVSAAGLDAAWMCTPMALRLDGSSACTAHCRKYAQAAGDETTREVETQAHAMAVLHKGQAKVIGELRRHFDTFWRHNPLLLGHDRHAHLTIERNTQS